MESVISSHHGHIRPTSRRETRDVKLGANLRSALARLKTMLTPAREEDCYLSRATDHADLEHRMRDVMRQEWKNTYLRW